MEKPFKTDHDSGKKIQDHSSPSSEKSRGGKKIGRRDFKSPFCDPLKGRLVDLVSIACGNHPTPSRTRPWNRSALMILRLKTWKSKSSPNRLNALTSLYHTYTDCPPIRMTAELNDHEIRRQTQAAEDLRNAAGYYDFMNRQRLAREIAAIRSWFLFIDNRKSPVTANPYIFEIVIF